MSNTPQNTVPPQKAIVVTTNYIKNLGDPIKVIFDPAVGNQLMTKSSQMHQMPMAEVKRFFEREQDNFGKLISQSAELRSCTPMSIYLAFARVMGLKLSFENGKYPLIYLIPGKRNIGTKENPNWIKEVVAQPSPYGEKEVRKTFGIIKDTSQSFIVHKGDVFEEEFDPTRNEVYVTKFKPMNKSYEIIASFIIITEPSGHIVHKVFKTPDWKRWEAASTKKNYGKTNPLYTSGIDGQIDESFLEGKTLSHAFKGYKQVDFAFKSPEGFKPDVVATVALNQNFMDDMIDAEYDEVPAGQIGDGGVQYDAPAKDAFDQEFENATKEQEQTGGVKVEVKSTDDEPGW